MSKDTKSNAESEADNDEEVLYEVEKILKKRKNPKTGKNEYFLKWKGFTSAHNSWEPEENLTDDLIQEFNASYQTPKRKSRAGRPSGSTSMLSVKDEAESIRMSQTMPTITPEKTRKTSETEREPDKIIGAKLDEKTGDILLLVKWKDSFDADLVPAKIANLKFPRTVIEFYESIFEWN